MLDYFVSIENILTKWDSYVWKLKALNVLLSDIKAVI